MDEMYIQEKAKEVLSLMVNYKKNDISHVEKIQNGCDFFNKRGAVNLLVAAYEQLFVESERQKCIIDVLVANNSKQP